LARRYKFLELTPGLFNKAMLAARKHRLRAYDAVQLTAALEVDRLNQDVGPDPVTLVSADRDLNAAATTAGLAVEDPNLHP
jgi:uncharacterized protein